MKAILHWLFGCQPIITQHGSSVHFTCDHCGKVEKIGLRAGERR